MAARRTHGAALLALAAATLLALRGACRWGGWALVGGASCPYETLGLPPKSTLQEVKRAFRKRALEVHPDRFQGEELEAASEKFVAVKEAYEELLQRLGAVPKGTKINVKEVGKDMTGFKRNMVSNQGHHKISDGRLYELWLDLRGQPEQLVNARQEVMMLFWRVRSVVDELGVSLAKEGYISAVLTDKPEEGKRSPFWDYGWMPLFLVDNSTGRIVHGETSEEAGRLRPSTSGMLLTAAGGGAGPEVEEELVVAAADARQAEDAQRRYGPVMRAIALPLDAGAWGLAAAIGTNAADVMEASAAVQKAVR